MIDFIKTNWVLLLILIIVIFLVYKFLNKRKEANLQVNKNNVKTVTDSFKNVISSNTGNVNTVIPPVSNTAPIIITPPPAVKTGFTIGDKVYAGSTGVNTYSNPSSGVNSLIRHYNGNEYIGTYLSEYNGYVKILVKNKVNSLLAMFGQEDNQIVYSIKTQVYNK